jgi:O-antigen ligase
MIFFYWLVGVMTLDQHWLWGRELFAHFTIIKLLGIFCAMIALFKMATCNASPTWLYDNMPSRCLIAFLILLAGGATHSAPAVVSTAYQHLLSIPMLWVIVQVLVDSGRRLRRTLLVAIGSAALASLYAVREQLEYGGATTGFRAAGIFSDSNQYALVVGLWIPLTFLWTVGKRAPWERLFCGVCLLVSFLGLFVAASRGGFIGLTAGFLYLIARSRRPMRSLLVISVLMTALLFWSPSTLLRRITSPNDGDRQGQNARLIAWKAGLTMIAQHPLVGIGMHNFKSQVLKYEEGDDRVESVAHNSYLEIAAETGLPSLLMFMGILGATFGALERVRKRSNRNNLKQLSSTALGLQTGLISYIFSSFFLSAWFEKMVWLLIFLSIVLYRISGESPSFPGKKVNRSQQRKFQDNTGSELKTVEQG